MCILKPPKGSKKRQQSIQNVTRTYEVNESDRVLCKLVKFYSFKILRPIYITSTPYLGRSPGSYLVEINQ